MTHIGPSAPSTPATAPRVRFGCCLNMVGSAGDPLGLQHLSRLAEIGFDYVELSLRDLTALSLEATNDVKRQLARAHVACEACNNFFPPEVRLTGPSADLSAAIRYAERALPVAASLGASIVVFGSSGARNVPEGFPMATARRQLADLLRALGPIADRCGLTIVLEHLCRDESNILNSLAETRSLADEIGHPRVTLLVDAYHARREHEPAGLVTALGPRIAHVHVAEGDNRVFPSGSDAFLAAFFRELGAIPYAGRISLEAFTRDFALDAKRGLQACRDHLHGGFRP